MKDRTLRTQLIDETAYVVVVAIREAIATTSEYHQKVFSTSFYHRELLLARVVEEIYARYLSKKREVPTHLTMLHFCQVEQAAIDSFVQESAIQILEDEPYWTEDA